ncbi:hypothetical protein QR680_007356 [Steinernema hermaphroditum]|uniref:POU-specific domain-containing protein n=1 Tax=Steinernema hermaphroditum TaxID=289476 RepID=A0AA39M6A4_9BILA|nr:hypothetical protein QR680_007356 [Steinernema hermaphroditum]
MNEQDGTMLNALEGKVKHAQCFDVALVGDGSVVLASKDYRLTQREVGELMGDVADRQISQTTISRFEDMAMSFVNIQNLSPDLEAFTDPTVVS